jgi:hypothetical protein
MNFAKFFHKAPGDDDRMLLLVTDSDLLIGSYMREVDYLGFDWEAYDKTKDNLPGEFMRVELDGTNEGIAAFRREAEALRQQGYIETHHTRHSLRDLGGDFTPKPDWQQAIDEALMSAVADPLEVQAERNAAFAGTPAQEQPLAKWLEARYASAKQRPDSLELARQACDAWLRCQADGHAGYIWSVYAGLIKGELFELLGREYLFEGPNQDPAAALDAIVVAREASPTRYRLWLEAWIICNHFPERESDAYDAIYRQAGDSYFSELTSRESFEAYAKYRMADQQAGRATWRWSSGTAAADEDEIAETENALAIEYPQDYRAFLKERGECSLFVRMPDEDALLKFAGPAQQIKMRDDFLNFVGRSDEPGSSDAFLRDYGVSLDHLIPIAEPRNASNLLLLHVGPGERYGYCYVWNHDGAWELVCEQPSFAAMKKKLLGGIVSKDPEALDLFNIHLFEEEEDEFEDED